MKKQAKGKNTKNAGRIKGKAVSPEVKLLGKRLRELRKSKGYSSYEDFAYTHDMTSSQYFAYEKGQNIEFNTLVRILKAMNVSLKEFFSEGFD
ncbi:MAG TPA: helix-turn-helix transcriptional regulator [Bacteroidia bacterium]|nr:helix-turn-helix transcriptional regulator [Bacteroidia bacterium]